MQRQAQRLFLIKQCMELAKNINCDCTTQDFKDYDLEIVKRIYRNMSKQAAIWEEVFGTTF